MLKNPPLTYVYVISSVSVTVTIDAEKLAQKSCLNGLYCEGLSDKMPWYKYFMIYSLLLRIQL